AASLMLAVVLAAIAVGGLAGGAWLSRDCDAARWLPGVACLAGVATVATYAAFQWLTHGTQIAGSYHTLWLACALTLPTSFLSGVFFTLLGDPLRRLIGNGTGAAGWLTLSNTAGGMCGPLVATFTLLPLLGMEGAIFTLTVVYALIGILSLLGLERPAVSVRSPIIAATAIVLLVVLVAFPFGLMKTAYVARVVQPYAQDGSTIVATRESPSE